MHMTEAPTEFPLPEGERIKVRGNSVGALPQALNPLTLPSPRWAEG
jgi:hypothetical protein